jgi:23S rRNA (cytidine1920-2'-O)/16S rRNA (cytidine1409-2'-O)-methyltransferase
MIDIDEKIDICIIDVTFTSLKSILPNVKQFLKNDGDILAIIKPFFESDFRRTQKFKIVENFSFLYKILVDLTEWCIKNHLNPSGIIKAPLSDIESSIEFFGHLRIDEQKIPLNFTEVIKKILTHFIVRFPFFHKR